MSVGWATHKYQHLNCAVSDSKQRTMSTFTDRIAKFLLVLYIILNVSLKFECKIDFMYRHEITFVPIFGLIQSFRLMSFAVRISL